MCYPHYLIVMPCYLLYSLLKGYQTVIENIPHGPIVGGNYKNLRGWHLASLCAQPNELRYDGSFFFMTLDVITACVTQFTTVGYIAHLAMKEGFRHTGA